MAVSLNDIKTKIASTKNTSQITNAMQMVSAAKLGRSEEAARNFQVYAQKVRKLLTDILHGNGSGGSTNPMLISRPVKKTGYIVITSDRGLVGGYNSSILKAVMELKEEYHPDGTGFEMICIGGMGADFFKARGIQPLYELRGLADQPSFDEVRKIISKTVEMYQNELFDELYVCYNHHVNTLTSQMRVEQMLPIVDLDPNEADEDYSLTFELETGREEILEQLLPQFAESMIYGAIIDAKTAENAAGMTAMQTATDNAKKVAVETEELKNKSRVFHQRLKSTIESQLAIVDSSEWEEILRPTATYLQTSDEAFKEVVEEVLGEAASSYHEEEPIDMTRQFSPEEVAELQARIEAANKELSEAVAEKPTDVEVQPATEAPVETKHDEESQDDANTQQESVQIL